MSSEKKNDSPHPQSLMDLTARQLIEESLKGSNPMLQIAMDAAEMAWWEMDVSTGAVYFSKKKTDMLGFESEAFLHYSDFMKLVHPEDGEKAMEAMRAHFRCEADRYEVEYRIKTKSGEYLWFYDIGSATLRDKNGKPLKVAGLVMNITERKKAEEEIKIKNEELIRLNSMKDKFFSIVAHDMKSPFQGLLGYSELLNLQYDELSDEERRQFIEGIYNLSQGSLKLLENLLDWARMQRGNIPFNPEVINLSAALGPTLDVLFHTAQNKNISLECNIDKDLSVNADRNMLSMIVRNLISNAIKFTHKEGRILFTAEKENGSVLFSVRDNGVGIDKENLKKLFSIDKKISRKGTNNESGTGLGLYLCQEMVLKHGGKIWAESELGKGCVFYFTIPVI